MLLNKICVAFHCFMNFPTSTVLSLVNRTLTQFSMSLPSSIQHLFLVYGNNSRHTRPAGSRFAGFYLILYLLDVFMFSDLINFHNQLPPHCG